MHRFSKRTTLGVLIGVLIFVGPWVPSFQRIPTIGHTAIAQTKGDSAQQADDTWQVIYIGGQRIGYSRTATRTEIKDKKKIIRTENETFMTIKRFGQELKIQTILNTQETDQGDLLGFAFEMKNPPRASLTRTVGRIDGKELVLETTVAGRKTKKTQAWDPDVKSPAYQDRLLRDRGIKPGDTVSFKTFLPELNKVTTVKVVADEMRPVKLLDGKERKLLKVRITQSILPTLTTRAYLDDKGDALKSESNFLGTSMITYTVSKDVALKAIAGAELDIAVNTLVRVKPIKDAHKTRKVVYRITTPGDDPSQYVVAGLTQSVKKAGADAVELTVTAVKPPRIARTVPSKPEYLAATRYLQSRDPRVVKHANLAASGQTNPTQVALRMERYVHEKLEEKNFSTALASAAEVAKNLEGDCTEHAVLLAAMLRAKQIASRIAVGMVYIRSRSSFGGHMWTEAYLGGKWIPLDATLGQGGIGAGHIKLAQSSFADDAAAPVTTFLPLLNVLGKLKIDVVKVSH